MNRIKLLPLAACTLALFAAGCASNLQYVRIPDLKARVEDPTKARVYVLRPSNMGYSAGFEVWEGNTHIGNTGGKSFLCWEREPGETIVSGREENVSTVSIWTKANEVSYILQEPRMGWIQARNEVKVISEAEATKLLKKCKPPQPGQCKDHPECRGEPAKKKDR